MTKSTVENTHKADEIEIRQLVENWALWRDTGDWDRFATVWHPEGRMSATFFEGPATQFIERARGAKVNALVHHVLGGTSVRVTGTRAIADTRMTIHMRVPVEGELCDVACIGRFFDLLEKLDGRWVITIRQPIYEKDRLDPVRPGAVVVLDEAFLAQYPSGYQYTAYAQAKAGLPVNRMLPGTGGAPLEPLMAQAEAWLTPA